MRDAAEWVASIDAIGTVPTSAAQLFGLINDPSATLADFERVVRPDVGLTVDLLRCANSAYYRASREITSVRDAISRMGLRRVFELTAGAALARAVPAALVGYQCSATQYWEHSVAVAVLADRLGREAGFTYPDLAFTAGLLHDLGKLVVSSWASRSGPSGLPEGVLRDIAAEQEFLGTTHAELGEALCLKWKLPKDIAGAARWHHTPGDAPTATLRYLSTVVQLADEAAHQAGFGAALAAGACSQTQEGLERLGLTHERVEAIVEGSRLEIERTCELLTQAAGGSARAA